MFPQGLLYVNKKGPTPRSCRHRRLAVSIQESEPWTVGDANLHRNKQKDQLAFTERVGISRPPRRITEVAMWRATPESTSANLSKQRAEWFGLRTRIVGAPTSYPDFTTVASAYEDQAPSAPTQTSSWV